MTKMAKYMMMRGDGRKDERRRESYDRYEDYARPAEDYYDYPESRRHRDRRGRFTSRYDDPYMPHHDGIEERYYPGMPHYNYEHRPMDYDYEPSGRMARDRRETHMIGFDIGGGDGERHREMIRAGGNFWMEDPRQHGKHHEKMNRFTAQQWVDKMENPDGTRGGKWTYDELKMHLQKKGIPEDEMPAYWAVINSLYSDYSAVLQKYNVSTIDLYCELAKAFINDPDAVPDKVEAYFDCIVKH